MFEQCSMRATRLVPQICAKRSGSPASAARAKNTVTPQTTAGKRGGKPCRNVEGEGATYDTGGEKVDTKEGTTKFGLPCNWLTDPILVAEIGGKPRPEAAISNA